MLRRIMLVLTVALVMAAMMVAVAAPAFAQANHLSGHAEIEGDECQGKGVITPSENVNVQCKIKPVGDNRGGAGGGGAIVERGAALVPFEEGIPVEGQAVRTPSGNVNAQANLHPEQD